MTLLSIFGALLLSLPLGVWTQALPLPAMAQAAIGAADYDLDGDLDLLLAGIDSLGQAKTMLLRNDTTLGFVAIPSTLPDLQQAALSWGDFDADGWPDLFLCGMDANLQPQSRLYRNASGTLNPSPTPNLPGIRTGAATWADMDGDGDLDLIVDGVNDDGRRRAWIGRNDGGVAFGMVPTPFIPGLADGDIAYGDLDGDADVDLLLSGEDSARQGRLLVLLNQGGLVFAEPVQQIPGLVGGSLSLADIDGDSDPDLLASGAGPGRSLRIMTNASQQFQELQHNLPAVAFGEARFADFDLDGAQDLAVVGGALGSDTLQVYKGSGNGTFTPFQTAFPLTGLHHASLAWADLNSDGHPDIVVSGLDQGDVPSATIYFYQPGGFPARFGN